MKISFWVLSRSVGKNEAGIVCEDINDRNIVTKTDGCLGFKNLGEFMPKYKWDVALVEHKALRVIVEDNGAISSKMHG